MAVNWEKFEQDEKVILDKGYRTECFVFVLHQTPTNMFSRVKSEEGDGTWEVMTYRLTKINNKQKK